MSKFGSILLALTFLLSCICTSCMKDSTGTGNGSATEQANASDNTLTLNQRVEKILQGYSAEDRKLLEKHGILEDPAVAMSDNWDDKTLSEYIKVTLESIRPIDLRQAGKVRGWPHIWNEIVSFRKSEEFYDMMLLVGNLDEDADSEFILPRHGRGRYELDGSRSDYPASWQAMYRIEELWDYDGDGIDELICLQDAPGSGKAWQIMKPDGTLLGDCPAAMIGPQIFFGDFDGDSHDDIYGNIRGERDPGLPTGAFGLEGRLLFVLNHDWCTPGLLTGDIDGDGLDELVTDMPSDNGSRNVMATGLDQKAVPLPVKSSAEHLTADFCGDIDGDGRAELLIVPEIHDFARNTATRLEWPDSEPELRLDGLFGGNVVCINIAKIPTLYAMTQCQPLHSQSVAAWDSSGRLFYYEHFGEELHALRKVKFGGRETILLMTDTRILLLNGVMLPG